jgi:hypothetical protein
MSQEIITPSTLTWDIVNSWDGPVMKNHMANPEMRAAIIKVVAERPFQEVQDLAIRQEASESAEQIPVSPTPEEVASAEQQRLAAEAEAQRLVAEAAKKKIVVEYQVRDEKGTPIGRVTHLEASSQEELIEKMKEAHTQATRAFHRLKQQRVQSFRDINNQPAPSVQPAQMSDADVLAALRDLKSDDPQVQLAAHRKLNAAEIAKVKAEAEAKSAEDREQARQQAVSFEFLKNHQTDYRNCQANTDLMREYFREHELPWTVDNLEIAFLALEDRLAPVAESTVETRPANPAPTSQSAATPTAAPVVQPAPTVPVTQVPPANPVQAQPRPGVNGGIVPGQNTAPRPSTRPQGLTIEEILSWDGPTMRAKMRSPQRAEIERVTREAQLRRGR